MTNDALPTRTKLRRGFAAMDRNYPGTKQQREYWKEQIGVDADDMEDAELTPVQLSKAVLLATLWPSVFGYDGDGSLKKAAECYGVDPKAIAAAVKAEFKAKADKKTGAAKKAAKKARKAR